MAGASAAREADMHTVDARVGVHKDIVSTNRAHTQQSRFVHSYFTAARWWKSIKLTEKMLLSTCNMS